MNQSTPRDPRPTTPAHRAGPQRPPTGRAAAAVVGALALGLAALGFAGSQTAHAADADTPVELGTAAQFAVLAGAGITNTGTTTLGIPDVIDGDDIGSFPTTDQTIEGLNLNGGTNQGGNAVTQGAKDDLVQAYNEAALALPFTAVPTELGGSTLVGGVYRSGTFGLTGTLTLDGEAPEGEASDKVFIFQAGTTLITAVDSSVELIGGAQACNVFWQVGSAATFDTRTSFVGTVMTYTEAITANTGATFEGRLLARDGAVTLDNNVITRPGCERAVVDADEDADADADGTDEDADGTDADGADADGTDADGTDADGTDEDADGTDADGTDADGTDADGTDADGQVGGGGAGSGGGGTDGAGGVTAGSGDVQLPDTGAESWQLTLIGLAAIGLGVAVLRRRPVR